MVGKHFRRYGLKASVLGIGLLSAFYIPYILLGLWNRAFGGWTSVFYCYAGSQHFIDTYGPGFVTRLYRWFPVPIGILNSDGTRGLVIASPVSERQFLNPANQQNFLRMQRRIRRIAHLIGAPRISLSGILPGIVRSQGVLQLEDNRTIVQRAVCAAVERIITRHFTSKPPIILIGGAGHIGAPIRDALDASGYRVDIVDPKSSDASIPGNLYGQPCLVVDCSRSGVLATYADQMWPGMVLLNEVFPRTPRAVVEVLSGKGIPCLHLSGLKGSIYPPLPHGYENAVPCCAAHGAAMDPEVVLIHLNPDVSGKTPLDATANAA